jgi:hypothetical protein
MSNALGYMLANGPFILICASLFMQQRRINALEHHIAVMMTHLYKLVEVDAKE